MEEETKRKSRLVHLIGDVSSLTINRLTKEVSGLWEEHPEEGITLHVASAGGSATAGLSFYEFIRVCKVPLTTIALGAVGSMGLLVWLSGTTRKASKNSVFLIHELRATYEKATLRTSELEGEAYSLRLTQDVLFRIIAEVSGRRVEEIEAIAMKEKAFTAKEAIGMGLLAQVDVIE